MDELPEGFMAEPAKVLHGYVTSGGMTLSEFGYQIGALSVALEIITRIKLLESLPITTEVGRQEAITVLQTMLTELGISDLAYEWYEKLSEWRKPKFIPQGQFERLEDALARGVVSDAPGAPLRPSQGSDDAPSSEPEVRRGGPSPLGSSVAGQLARRSLDEAARAVSWGLTDEAVRANKNE